MGRPVPSRLACQVIEGALVALRVVAVVVVVVLVIVVVVVVVVVAAAAAAVVVVLLLLLFVLLPALRELLRWAAQYQTDSLAR